MKAQHIRTLVAIADSGSLRTAATMLGRTQPAVTKALRQAEEDIGVPLFHRSSRGVIPTEMGERVLLRARSIVSEIDRLDDDIAQYHGEQTGSVRVCVSPLAAVRIMPRALVLFRQTHPLIDVHLTSGLFPSALKPLREGQTDLLIGPKPTIGMTRDIYFEPLLETPITLITATGSPFAQATSLSDLIDADWITIGAPTGPGDIYRKPFLYHGLTPPSVRTTSESYFGALALVENLGAVCTFPQRLLDTVSADWGITAIPIKEDIAPLEIGLMTRASHPLTPAADALAQCIRRRSGAI